MSLGICLGNHRTFCCPSNLKFDLMFCPLSEHSVCSSLMHILCVLFMLHFPLRLKMRESNFSQIFEKKEEKTFFLDISNKNNETSSFSWFLISLLLMVYIGERTWINYCELLLISCQNTTLPLNIIAFVLFLLFLVIARRHLSWLAAVITWLLFVFVFSFVHAVWNWTPKREHKSNRISSSHFPSRINWESEIL